MFDLHMHSRVSFDGRDTAYNMAQAAVKAGLTHICFTDHMDYDPIKPDPHLAFDITIYNKEYDDLQIPDLTILKGFEFGMLADNQEQFRADIARREWDFVLGSVHFVDGLDVYFEPFWAGRTPEQTILRGMEETLRCVQNQDDFDVLAHLTYLAKTHANPVKQPILYKNYREVVDEILKVLVDKGKGLEVNTSGVDACGAMLPDEEYLRRFKELGGQIVTVGSDAHDARRVGQYCQEAARKVQEIFGYVCTFAGRKPVFHTL